MVVLTNLESISYFVKNKKFDFGKSITLFNEAVDKNNKANNIKDLQVVADYFLKNSYNVCIGSDNCQEMYFMSKKHVILSERLENLKKVVEWGGKQQKKILNDKGERIAEALVGK